MADTRDHSNQLGVKNFRPWNAKKQT